MAESNNDNTDSTGGGGENQTTSTDTDEGRQQQSGTDTDLAAEVEKWKGLARKHERDARQAAKRVADFEDANKTELEKAADKAAAAEERAAEFESRLLRAEVAQAKGLTATQAKRLVGVTREELEADAEELLADLKGQGRQTDDGRPREQLETLKLEQGSKGMTDMDSWMRAKARNA